MIFDMKVLEALAMYRPTDIEHFKQIEGVEEQKAQDYGAVSTEMII